MILIAYKMIIGILKGIYKGIQIVEQVRVIKNKRHKTAAQT